MIMPEDADSQVCNIPLDLSYQHPFYSVLLCFPYPLLAMLILMNADHDKISGCVAGTIDIVECRACEDQAGRAGWLEAKVLWCLAAIVGVIGITDSAPVEWNADIHIICHIIGEWTRNVF